MIFIINAVVIIAALIALAVIARIAYVALQADRAAAREACMRRHPAGSALRA